MITLSAQPAELSPVLEVQKDTGSEKKLAKTAAVVAKPQKVAEAVRKDRDLGRGGATHQAIQERLQAEAQKLGFLTEVEKQLAKGSNDAADLVLKRDGVAIAVEITVTTTVSHEFENVQKCLKAGFKRVAVVSISQKRLEDIAASVKGGRQEDAQ